VAVLALALAACAGGDQRVTGTVVSVEGDLTSVSGFTVQTDSGPVIFVPDADLRGFLDEDGEVAAPLTHLWDHLRDGYPVRVTFRVEGDINVALIIEDG
jgi:hypothetical protein